jgi:lipoyl(octanoyl) transferase
MTDGSSLEYETFSVERAGEATYHGPGQLVVYPILDLGYFKKDINFYLRSLEETIMNTLSIFDITSKRIDGLTGVWTNLPDGRDSKIAAIGIYIFIYSYRYVSVCLSFHI